MAEVFMRVQKYINLEAELKAEQLRKTTNPNQRSMNDNKRKEDISIST